VRTFPLKTLVAVWCIVKIYTNHPCEPIPKSGTATEMVSQRKACLLCSKPTSAFTVSFHSSSSPQFWTAPGQNPPQDRNKLPT
jgi:hypothetical protein